ncbi:hypothetical protein BB561_005210 [Smittium simulii]|uniref:Uncharacterized protein n=1 Tax=Smittium simulii TaxID=133385 RepID=A0A2T9YBJ1_9FUNG|nr:hypothetical protein BB561_005210 [Smittium simulii]
MQLERLVCAGPFKGSRNLPISDTVVVTLYRRNKLKPLLKLRRQTAQLQTITQPQIISKVYKTPKHNNKKKLCKFQKTSPESNKILKEKILALLAKKAIEKEAGPTIKKKELQNRQITDNMLYDTHKLIHNFSGSQKCIHGNPNTLIMQEIPEVQLEKKSIYVLSTTIWPSISPYTFTKILYPLLE